MFPLKYPPKIPGAPSLDLSSGQLSDDEYVASLLLKDAEEAKKRAERVGVLSYLKPHRVVRREKPNTSFLQNVVRSTIIGNQYQDSRDERERTRDSDLRKLDATGQRMDRSTPPPSGQTQHSPKATAARAPVRNGDSSELIGPPAPPPVAAPKQSKGRGTFAYNAADRSDSDNDPLFDVLPAASMDPPALRTRYDDLRARQSENAALRRFRETQKQPAASESDSSNSRQKRRKKEKKEKKAKKKSKKAPDG